MSQFIDTYVLILNCENTCGSDDIIYGQILVLWIETCFIEKSPLVIFVGYHEMIITHILSLSIY